MEGVGDLTIPALLQNVLVPRSDAINVADNCIIRILVKPASIYSQEDDSIRDNDNGKVMEQVDIGNQSGTGIHPKHTRQDTSSKRSTPVEFLVPRTILCVSSQFFQAATSDRWDDLRPENSKRTVIMTCDPEIMEAYINWLYFKQIPLPENYENDETPPHQKYIFLAKLCVFGEEIQDKCFMTVIVKSIAAMVLRFRVCPGPEVVTIIYEGTPVGSPVRQLMIDAYADNAEGNWPVHKLPQEAITDLLRTTLELRPPLNSYAPWCEVAEWSLAEDEHHGDIASIANIDYEDIILWDRS